MHLGRQRPGFRARKFTLILPSGLCIALVTTAIASAAHLDKNAVLKAARSALSHESAVHLVLNATPGSEKVIADLGTTVAIEKISEGKSTVTIEVTPKFGYVSGNSAGLTGILGLTSKQAKRIGTRWVSMKAGTTAYSGLRSSTTISSLKSLLPKPKGTTLGASSSSGYTLRWTTAASSSTPKLVNTLVISSVGPTLPEKAVAAATGGFKETTTFSNWNETVHVSAPKSGSTITYAKATA